MKNDKTMEYDEMKKYTITSEWGNRVPVPENFDICILDSYLGDRKRKISILDPKSKEIIQEGLWKGLKKPVIYTPSFFDIDNSPKQIWIEDEKGGELGFFAREEKDDHWTLYKGKLDKLAGFAIFGLLEIIQRTLSEPFIEPDLGAEKHYWRFIAEKIKNGNYLKKNDKIRGYSMPEMNKILKEMLLR